MGVLRWRDSTRNPRSCSSRKLLKNKVFSKAFGGEGGIRTPVTKRLLRLALGAFSLSEHHQKTGEGDYQTGDRSGRHPLVRGVFSSLPLAQPSLRRPLDGCAPRIGYAPLEHDTPTN
jgi:hypothetical protein